MNNTFLKAFGGTLGVLVAIVVMTMCCCVSFAFLSAVGSTITITPIP